MIAFLQKVFACINVYECIHSINVKIDVILDNIYVQNAKCHMN